MHMRKDSAVEVGRGGGGGGGKKKKEEKKGVANDGEEGEFLEAREKT